MSTGAPCDGVCVAILAASASDGVSSFSPSLGLLVFGAGLLGALIVELLDIAYLELRRGSERRITARRFVDENLDPVLKAADEVVGKLRSLAGDDFRSLRKRSASQASGLDFVNVLYLLAKFWASLEAFRSGGQTVSALRDQRGEKLNRFVDCMESRKVRIVDRAQQRAVAELVLLVREGRPDILPFIEFVRRFEDDQETQRWLFPLARVLDRMEHTSDRQRLLRYGVVIHAMIDTLDPGHQVSRDRPSYPYKLSRKSWRDLKYRSLGSI